MVFFLVAIQLAEGQNESHTKQVLESSCINPGGKAVGQMSEIHVRLADSQRSVDRQIAIQDRDARLAHGDERKLAEA